MAFGKYLENPRNIDDKNCEFDRNLLSCKVFNLRS
jgi:hypothetical protein